MVKNLFKKTTLLAASALFGLAVVATAATNFIGTGKTANADANSPDAVNIIEDGLVGPSLGNYIDSLRVYCQRNNDGNGHTDLQAVYSWLGSEGAKCFTDLNTSNTSLGYVNKDGTVVLADGTVVGTNAMVTARFSGPGYVHVEGDVYARYTTTYEQYDHRPALIYMQNGQVVFAVETQCGNAVKVTPKPPKTPPTASLACVNLLLTKGTVDQNGNASYTLTAQATANNATITGYTFDFGDKSAAKQTTANTTTHTYAPGTYTAKVTVQGSGANGASAPSSVSCSAPLTVSQAPTVALTCDQLTLTKGDTDQSTGNTTYTLNVKASTTNATITKYVFSYGDSAATTDTVTTGNTQASSKPFSYAPGTYGSIYVTVYATANGKTLTAGGAKSACATNLTVPPQTCANTPSKPECQPTCTSPSGQTYPAGSAQCQPTPPATTTATPPTSLPNTGAGNIIGLFSGTSIIGALAHRFILKRRALGSL